MHYLSHFSPFLGLRLFKGDDLFLFNYILALLISFPLFICKIKLGRVGWKRSWRSGLDNYFRHCSSCMGFQEVEQACFGFSL